MKLREQQGQALVELALSLVVLMLIVFGITEFGRAMYLKNTLVNVAREGARKAAVSSKAGDFQGKIDTYVRDRLPVGFDQTGLTVTCPAPVGETVTVTVTQTFQSMVPLITQLCSLPLTGQATMRYEM